MGLKLLRSGFNQSRFAFVADFISSIFAKTKAAIYSFTVLVFLFCPVLSFGELVPEPPAAVGYVDYQTYNLYPSAEVYGELYCNRWGTYQGITATFSRMVETSGGGYLYCLYNGAEYAVGSHSWWTVCEPGATVDTQEPNTRIRPCVRNSTVAIPAKNLEEQPDSCADKKYAGNPVNSLTGNKFQEEIDYKDPLQILDFKRFYNSQNGASPWRHTYQRTVRLTADSTSFFTSSTVFTRTAINGSTQYFAPDDIVIPTNLPPRVVVTRSSGRTYTFIEENGVWVNLTDDESGNQLEQTGNGWIYTADDDTVETYDTAGNLVSIANPDGRIQTLSYDANNRLITVTDDVGRTLSFTYDSSGRIQTLTDPAGGIYWYTYNADNIPTSITYPDTKVRAYHYNEQAYTNNTDLPYALTGITDENGVRYATYTYDTQGRAIVTEHAGGANRYELAHNPGYIGTYVTDPLGSQYTNKFQTVLGVTKGTSQSQPAGSGCSAASSATTYDINGNVASRADFNGNKTCYAYDLNRNLEIARVEGLSAGSSCPADVVNYAPAPGTSERKIVTSWHANFRLPAQVTEDGRETTISYDGYGNVTQLSIRDTASNETRTWNTSYTYHPTVPGVIVQRIEDGPRTDVSDITTIDYYAPDAACTGGHFGCRGQVMRITNALGHVTDITRYNAHGQAEQIVDPNNLTTTLTYDARQRLVSRVVGTETTTYQYDNAGQLIQLTRPDGSSLYYTYDAAHRLTDITDSLGNAIRYTLDAAGNRTQEEIFDASNTLAQTRQQEFDALNRLWKMTGAQNQITELAYDANGNLKQTTDPLLHISTRQFDTLDRLIQANDPMGGQTLQQHDALDQITQVTDPKGVATSYTTNAFGDVTQEVSQDRGTTTYTYDLAGNQLTKTDARGVVQTTTYDALNRPISQSYSVVAGIPQTGTITWTYDTGTNGTGRLTQMSDESGSTSYQYDQYGRLTSKTQTVVHNGENFIQSLSYQYNANGQLTRITYPSGTQIDYAYGTDGRPTELRINGNILMQNIAYRPFGEPESWNWGNGQVFSRGFDLDGRLTQHPLGADTQTLTYDAASRIVNTTNSNPVYNRTYEYDALDRLIRQTDNTSTRLWGYDANSNRISEQPGATVYPYTIDTNSNRLLSVAGPVAKTYTYDAAGNPLGDGTRTFTWNAAGRLVQTTISGNDTLYQYNGSGERVNKGISGTNHTFFLFDPAGRLIGDYLENQSTPEASDWLLGQETVWFGDIPVAVIKQASPTDPVLVYMIHTDHLNTPRVIVDSTNTPVWLWRNQNAFGDNSPNEDPDGDSNLFEYNLRFAGQYFDTETGLLYNYFRDYEPATGRYLSSDPIGLAGGLNTYGYVSGNPLSFTDPTGEAIPAIIAACAGNPACAAAVSAGVGALTGALFDIASQLLDNGGNLECIDKGDVALSAAAGAIPAGAVGAIGSKLLGKFVAKRIDDIISSASRPARVGSQDSRALQALKKKIDRGDDAFSGLPKTQNAANDLIRQTLSTKNPVVRTGTRNGKKVRDVFDSSTGRGVRTIDGEFDTFINLK